MNWYKMDSDLISQKLRMNNEPGSCQLLSAALCSSNSVNVTQLLITMLKVI